TEGAIFLPPRQAAHKLIVDDLNVDCGMLINNPQSTIDNRSLSHSSLLRWTAPVVWQWGDVLDPHDLQPRVLQIQDGLLAAGAGAFDFDLDLDHAGLARLLGGVFGGAPGGVGGALARALEIAALA